MLFGGGFEFDLDLRNKIRTHEDDDERNEKEPKYLKDSLAYRGRKFLLHSFMHP
jgi:hypothetical protein